MTDKTVIVNIEDWDGPQVGPDEIAWNAPRPLLGSQRWEGRFRAGIFYAITGPDDDARFAEENVRLDARRVELIDNSEVERRVMAMLAEYGYGSPEESGLTIAELARSMELPYADRPS
jgi:hypothetical protein